jgi:hypothetical protein
LSVTQESFLTLARQADIDPKTFVRFVETLRRSAPLAAHARPALLAFLQARGAAGRASPRLEIVDIFQANVAGELMCRFVIREIGDQTFVAPFAHVALDRNHPLVRRFYKRCQHTVRKR